MSAWADLSPGWQAAWAQGWEAYQTGNVPVGAAIVNEVGEVLAVGRNRTREARQVDGVISGFDLAHAEVNALLRLPRVTREEGYALTLLTTLEPCPQCAGTLVMSQVRRLSYAATDPWAGCASLFSENAYMASKGVAVSRGPSTLAQAGQVLNLLTSLEDESFAALTGSALKRWCQTRSGWPIGFTRRERYRKRGALKRPTANWYGRAKHDRLSSPDPAPAWPQPRRR